MGDVKLNLYCIFRDTNITREATAANNIPRRYEIRVPRCTVISSMSFQDICALTRGTLFGSQLIELVSAIFVTIISNNGATKEA